MNYLVNGPEHLAEKRTTVNGLETTCVYVGVGKLLLCFLYTGYFFTNLQLYELQAGGCFANMIRAD